MCVGIAFQRTNQLERDPYSGVIFPFAAAVGTVRIHHRHRRGQGILRLVVVGHHHIDSLCRGIGDLLHRGDTVVYRDNQGGSAIRQRVNGFRVQTVAGAFAFRHQIGYTRAAIAQIAVQQHGGGHAVCIVISKHGDGFLRIQCPLDTLHRHIHIGKSKRIIGPFATQQKLRHIFDRVDAAHGQQINQKRVDAAFF